MVVADTVHVPVHRGEGKLSQVLVARSKSMSQGLAGDAEACISSARCRSGDATELSQLESANKPEARKMTAADQLLGKDLANGWTVTEKLVAAPNSTGGHFSTAYRVRSSTGKLAFLKAMDYSRALADPDPAMELQILTTAYNFERDLLKKCRSRRLSRVVTVLDDGRIEARVDDPSSVVQYLIFELADGDIRSIVQFDQRLDDAWILRTLHSVTTALTQLHSAGIAHQDLKPSNVLAFHQRSLREHFKLADLGRASDRIKVSPHDWRACAGDKTYAPLELLYGYTVGDWDTRRFGCDLYLLGSLIVYFYTGTSLTQLILGRISPEHHYSKWTRTYTEVLPYLQHEFVELIGELERYHWNGSTSEVSRLVKELSALDPNRRGHPKDSATKNKHSLHRYISILDRLATRAEISIECRLVPKR